MPFEAIACTRCGSTEVQEVKPSTYFCNHCETVFKHIDPTRLTVDHGPAFCSCGNPVQVQCQVCKTGVCRDCDTIEWRRSAGIKEPGHCGAFNGPPDISVSAIGYGYLESSKYSYLRPGGEKEFVISRGRIVTEERSGPAVIGPFLGVNKILSALRATHGDLRHVCCTCVESAAPATAEHVRNGDLCETPRCAGWSTGRCPCCEGAFCKRCSLPGSVPDELTVCQECTSDWCEHIWVFWEDSPNGSGLYPGYVRPKNFPHINGSIVRWLPPRGLCLPCVAERQEEAKEMALRVCQQEYGALLAFGSKEDYPYRPAVFATRRRADRSRGHVIAEEVGERVRKAVVIAGNCGRKRSPGEAPWDRHTTYAVGIQVMHAE